MLRSLLVLALVVGFALPTLAMSESEVRNSYYACMRFLTYGHAKQVKIAARSGYSLAQVQWACEYQREMGLEQMEWCEIRYQAGYEYCD